MFNMAYSFQLIKLAKEHKHGGLTAEHAQQCLKTQKWFTTNYNVHSAQKYLYQSFMFLFLFE